MGGVPDCGKKTGGADDRSGSIAGVQVVVRSIPATTVLQDQVVLAGVCPNAPYVPCACTCTCGTPYTVPFYPVSASICGKKPRIAGIPADCISLNSVPGALALVARKEDSIISISADVAIGEDVFAALAQKATKVDAIPFVPVLTVRSEKIFPLHSPRRLEEAIPSLPFPVMMQSVIVFSLHWPE